MIARIELRTDNYTDRLLGHTDNLLNKLYVKNAGGNDEKGRK